MPDALYEGQALMCELVALLQRIGFDPYRLDPEFVDPRSGQMLQVNGLFARTVAAPDVANGTT